MTENDCATIGLLDTNTKAMQCSLGEKRNERRFSLLKCVFARAQEIMRQPLDGVRVNNKQIVYFYRTILSLSAR